MGVINIKRFLVFALAIMLFVFSNLGEVSAKQKTQDDLTMKEAQDILFEHFEKYDKHYKVGSIDYLEYLMGVLLEDADKKLAKHPNYEQILFYAGEYVHLIDEQQVYQKPGEEQWDFTEFENKTIGKSKKENAEEELELERKIQSEKSYGSNNNLFSLASTYSGTNAAKYATTWYNGRNSLYNNHVSDCTNFVSQAVYAGGMAMKKPTYFTNGIWETTSYWYSVRYSMPNYSYAWYESTSWVRVTDFYTYWAKTQNVVASSSASTIINNVNVGDVVQLKRSSDGSWYHSMIVTKKADGTIYLSGHTNNTLDKPIKDIPAAEYRVIKFS